METHNFHYYIGSKAEIFNHDLFPGAKVTLSCQNFSGIFFQRNSKGSSEWMAMFNSEPGEMIMVFKYLKLVLRPIESMTNKELVHYRSILSPTRPNFDLHSSWTEREEWDILTAMKRNDWLIKKGFDVGLIPREKYILTTEIQKG